MGRLQRVASSSFHFGFFLNVSPPDQPGWQHLTSVTFDPAHTSQLFRTPLLCCFMVAPGVLCMRHVRVTVTETTQPVTSMLRSAPNRTSVLR